jgi:hypothetical protein
MCLYQARGCLKFFHKSIGQAMKMLASLPLDNQINLLMEERPIYQHLSSHSILMLDYFQGEVFGGICHHVQSSQKGEHNLVTDKFEPSTLHYQPSPLSCQSTQDPHLSSPTLPLEPQPHNSAHSSVITKRTYDSGKSTTMWMQP